MHNTLKLTALSLGLMCAANALAATDLTVISFGGANKAAQVKEIGRASCRERV